jgi:predicted rRNA methylase YqxC with S4 and FtsJ domains
MNESGQLFGWAFGDAPKAHVPGYLETVQAAALENAKQEAASRGFEVEAGSEHFAVVEPGETLIDVGAAPGGLVVRCTVTIAGAGAAGVHPEGPMNG